MGSSKHTAWKTPTFLFIYAELSILIFTEVYFQSWRGLYYNRAFHYHDVIMSAMASQITSHSSVYSDADQRKHQNSASLAFVRGIHRWQVNSTHKGPVMQKMCPFDDVIMHFSNSWYWIGEIWRDDKIFPKLLLKSIWIHRSCFVLHINNTGRGFVLIFEIRRKSV